MISRLKLRPKFVCVPMISKQIRDNLLRQLREEKKNNFETGLECVSDHLGQAKVVVVVLIVLTSDDVCSFSGDRLCVIERTLNSR